MKKIWLLGLLIFCFIITSCDLFLTVKAIDISEISGVSVPASNQTPVTNITETDQYTGTVSWSPDDTVFKENTVYTATIILKEKNGYTFKGIAKDFFKVAGATSVSNDANSGKISVLFPNSGGAIEAGFSAASSVGDKGTVTTGSNKINLIYANNRDKMTFFYQNYNTKYLETKFFIAETETTWATLKQVFQWAVNNNKIVDTPGAHNEVTSKLIKYGGQILIYLDPLETGTTYHAEWMKLRYDENTHTFSIDKGYEDYPAGYLTWYGAIMFCNWFTEMRDGNTDNIVYSGIDTTWRHAYTVADTTKNGFRLPTTLEWEYAATYIKDKNGDDYITDDGEYYPGDFASGADAKVGSTTGAVDYDGDGDIEYSTHVAWYLENSNSESKKIAQKSPNALGLYDMSGNIVEWCDNGPSDNKVLRSSSLIYGERTVYLECSATMPPKIASSDFGFRIARTAEE